MARTRGPLLEASFFSTAFSVAAFQEEATELVEQLSRACTCPEDPQLLRDTDASDLRFFPRQQLEAQALQPVQYRTHSAEHASGLSSLTPADGEDKDDKDDDIYILPDAPKRRRTRAKHAGNVQGKPYQAPAGEFEAAAARKAALDGVRNAWDQQLNNAAQALETVRAAVTGSARGPKGIHPVKRMEEAPVAADRDLAQPAAESTSAEQLAEDEVILILTVYKAEPPALRKLQEVAVLGSQPVQHLKSRDMGPPPPPQPGSCEGCSPSIDPAAAPKPGENARQGPEFTAREMSSVSFAELGLRAGAAAGYSLCHQGCCEHQLAVSDVRRLHPHDPRERSDYPMVLYQAYSNRQLCDMCEKHAATKVTYDDIVAHKCPALWCALCYEKLHYDAEDQVIDPSHKVFPYISG
ncbi:hypothetical protein WJX73_009403 [Symbiochloris irregularis]|uniref:snRNA-activating protein complex subunit 3 n=1 Tax=Symbiochloris irregularis TaxID=706552 RepID=A0AAW1PEJ2_9CHLO